MRHLLLLLLIGCASVVSPRKTYRKAADHQVRKMVIYFEAQTALILRGTLLSPEYREAMAAERERLMAPPPADQAAWVARQRDDAQMFHEVVFAADSHLEMGNVFGRDGWQVWLLADGTEEKLVTLHRVRKPTALQEALFPQLNIWSDLWVARFERTVASPEDVTFRVGSGYGNGEISWTGDSK